MIIKGDEEKLFKIFSMAYQYALPVGDYCKENFDKSVGFYEQDLFSHREENDRKGFSIDYINHRYMKLSARPIFAKDDTIWKLDHTIRVVQDELVEDWATELKRTWDGPDLGWSNNPTDMEPVWYIMAYKLPLRDYYVC